jgi:hypothetical protein
MDKNQMLDQVKEVMIRMTCGDLEAAETRQVSLTVDRFIREEVTRLSLDQILDRFITPMDVLAWFQSYIAGRLVDACCSGKESASVEACDCYGG